MKFLVVVCCLLAVAYAKAGHLAASVAPLAYNAVVPSSFGYSYASHYAAPVAHAAYSAVGVAPAAYSTVGVAPAAYSTVGVAPAVHSTVVSTPVAHSVVAPTAYSTVGVAPVAHSTVVSTPVAPVAHSVVAVEKTQYHAQDVLGQAAYGHSEAFQTHNAVQDASGNKIGSYSYVAPNGQVVATNYVADALGYRVASNAAPVDTPEVVSARLAHLHEVEAVKHRSRRSALAPVALPLTYTGYSVPSAPIFGRSYVSPVVSVPHGVSYRYY